MLIDNKTDIYGQGQVQTVWNYLHDHVQQGNLDIVSGFFSIAGLHALYTELNPDVKYRLILSEMTRDDGFMNKVLDLLQGDSSITNALQLSDYAKNAVAFLRRQTVEVRSVSNAFCHAKAYVYQIAVAALAGAEWDMDVDAKTRSDLHNVAPDLDCCCLCRGRPLLS